MITLIPNGSLTELKSLINQEKLKAERVEVILFNLLALTDEDSAAFNIPFDDVTATIQTAISLLKS